MTVRDFKQPEFAEGDRVRVADNCAWPDRRGKFGVVMRVDQTASVLHGAPPDLSYLVQLDGEPARLGQGTAFFEPTSLEKTDA